MIGDSSTNTSTSGTRLILIKLRLAITAASLTACNMALTWRPPPVPWVRRRGRSG